MLKQKPKPSLPQKRSAAVGASHSTYRVQPSAVSIKLRRPRSESTSDKLAQFVAGLSENELPQAVQETAKEHLLDGFATMLGGAAEDASQRIDGYLRNFLSRPEATVIGSTRKVNAQYAALANGIRGHVLDYDDAQLATLRSRPYGQLTHPTTPVLAAALALAEKINATGLELLAAYIVGVEVACRLADAIDPDHYLKGFHPTGTIGAFGATAACAHLLKLDFTRTRWAVGIAGSLASGLRAHRGTMAKSLNAGHAAENGIVAATLAQTGFTASTDVFDDPMGYFAAACYGMADRKRIKFGAPYFLLSPGVAMKIYPCAGVLHPALDAIIELAKEHDLRPTDVKRIRVSIGPDAALPLVYPSPRNALEAKFSLPFSAAVALIYRRAGLEQYKDATLLDRNVAAAIRRVELLRDPRLRSVGNLGCQAEVEILLKNRRTYRKRATVAKGHPKKPLTREEIQEKFYVCAGDQISKNRARKFVENLWSIEKVDALAPWLQLLRPARR
jgi:2-methylcitrate dehydratase PrpD